MNRTFPGFRDVGVRAALSTRLGAEDAQVDYLTWCSPEPQTQAAQRTKPSDRPLICFEQHF